MEENFLDIFSIEKVKNEDDDFNLNLNVNVKKDDYLNEEKDNNKTKLALKAGRIFKKKFMDCSKYIDFVINFCKYHETIDLYKIPYTFINEFIYYSHFVHKSNLKEVNIFNIIDQFYGKNELKFYE